ncbi:MAG: MATE family efflux transporter [Clostridiales bacterium]|nr:MATE family efflux transporter [Clostridiales bacterium]
MHMDRAMFSKKQIYDIIIPLILEQLFMAAIGMFDIVMVSGIGENAISAVSLVDFINQLIYSVLNALCTGGAIVCSQFLGQKEKGSARAAVQHMIMLAVCAGSVLMMAGLAGNGPILRVLYRSIAPEVMSKARVYFALSSVSWLFIGLFCCSAATLRVLGYTRISFHTSLCMNVINIGLNALFIFGLKWGVFGAGLASLISRVVVSLFMFRAVLCRQKMLDIGMPWKWKPARKFFVTVLNCAIPTGLESSIFYIGRLLVQTVVTEFGTSAIAANAVGLTVTEFLHMPGSGVSIGMITIVGRCVGADEKKQARSYARYLIGVVYVSQGILNVIVAILSPWIADRYHLMPQAKELLILMLVTHAVISTIFWPMAFTGASALKAAGDIRYAMIVAVSTMWIFRVAGSWLLVHLVPQWGVLSVWYAMYADWIVRAMLEWKRMHGEVWLNKRIQV